MSDEVTNSNGSATVKEMVREIRDGQTRLEGKLDAHIAEEAAGRAVITAAISENRMKMEVHASDEHPRKVNELRDAELREEGRKDVLRYIFGASLMGFLAGVISLIATIWNFLSKQPAAGS